MLPTLAHPARARQNPTRDELVAARAAVQVRLRGLDLQRAVLPEDAPLMRLAAHADPSLLPRWHQDDRGARQQTRGHHVDAPPGAYAGIRAWNGRDHWLAYVVPTALAVRADLVRAHRVAPDTFALWARTESAYVGRPRSGRRLVVRPSTVAQVMDVAERTVQRCRALARALGLLVDVLPGRMLTLQESIACRRRGSRQRGLSTEAALTIPSTLRRLVDRVTPTRGGARRGKKLTLDNPTDSAAGGAAGKEAASRPPKPGRRRRPVPVIQLARAVQDAIPWLRHETIASLIPSLHRFAMAERPWSAADVRDGIDMVIIRRGWSAVRGERIRTRPAALLAWHLRQLDPDADHPGPTFGPTSRAQWPTWCGHCDQQTRQRWVPEDALAYRCHVCHPLVGRTH